MINSLIQHLYDIYKQQEHDPNYADSFQPPPIENVFGVEDTDHYLEHLL